MRIIGENMSFEQLHEIERTVFDAAHILYGCTVSGGEPLLHKNSPYARVEEEWKNIISMNNGHGWKSLLLLKRVTDWLKARHSPYWMSGTAGSSLVLYLLGITECNPLPPHRYIHARRGFVWTLGKADGFDLDETVAETDDRSDWDEWAYTQEGTGDGHHLPYMLMKWNDLCIRCSPACETDMRKEFASLGIMEDQEWLNAKHKRKQEDPREWNMPPVAVNIAFTEDIPETDKAFFHAKITAKNWRRVLKDSGLTNEAFMDKCFNLSANALLEKTRGNTHYAEDMRELIGCFREETLFADMVTFGGLCVNGVWDSTAKTLVKGLGYPVHSMIAFRDDVYYWLLSVKSMRYGVMGSFDEGDAYCICELCTNREDKDSYLRRGITLDLDGNYTVLPCMGLEPWILKQIQEHPYLFSKAHAVEHILFHLRLLAAEQMRKG